MSSATFLLTGVSLTIVFSLPQLWLTGKEHYKTFGNMAKGAPHR
jgi:hypothetical protein